MIDQYRIRRAFARAAAGFDNHDFLHREIRDRLLERLQAVAIEPDWILDLGAGTGGATPAMTARFADARILSIDSSAAMLSAGAVESGVCADAENLPLADQCVDLIVSNLMLHHCPNPTVALSEARRVLSDHGLLMFTTFGTESFVELGRAWATADRFTHVAPFFDILQLGNLLTASGFTEPVLDCQTLTVTYENLTRMTQDLQRAGATNSTSGKNRGLTGRGVRQRFIDAYDQLRGPDGKLPVTLEIIFGVAWADGRTGTSKEFEIFVNDIRRVS